ncbi:MAG TPA: hypothetical protein VF526_02320 [Solirubrobacteraceae bacterium]
MSARLTAVAESLAEPCLPFFIERGSDRPVSHARVANRVISWIEVGADSKRLEQWLGRAAPAVRIVEGEPSVRAIGIGDRELRTS